jgi:hypothetical protein
MIFQIFKQYKRLSWFLGIPGLTISLLYLIRFYFLSRNSGLPPPGALNPNNPIKFSSMRKLGLKDYENEFDSVKRSILNPEQKKLIPLVFPNRDSIHRQDLNLTENSFSRGDLKNSGLIDQIRETHEDGRINFKRPEFYDPSLEEVQKYPVPVKPRSLPSSAPVFNSYTKPEKTDSKLDKTLPGPAIIKTRVVEDQTITEGSQIQLRLWNALNLGTIKLPRNTLLNARVVYEGDRVIFKISQIHWDNLELKVQWVCQGMDLREGIPMKELPGNNKPVKSYFNETKNQIVQDLGNQVLNSVPYSSSLVNNTLRKSMIQDKKPEFKLNDEYEINFTSLESQDY